MASGKKAPRVGRGEANVPSAETIERLRRLYLGLERHMWRSGASGWPFQPRDDPERCTSDAAPADGDHAAEESVEEWCRRVEERSGSRALAEQARRMQAENEVLRRLADARMGVPPSGRQADRSCRCGGSGRMTCHICDGRGTVHLGGGDIGRCPQCRGERTLPCRFC